eukprot:TRINITY_DN3480_c0_g2_i1.p1 TRINITY_DN3480_c0_g2~~TRINITY_DN3480_c0_g2_i1.p1  ORF type:complete len:334 (+),score=121.08 TRINITY_DN3480_c0_g2_i1:85-1086(+)
MANRSGEKIAVRMLVNDSFTNQIFAGNPAAVCLFQDYLAQSSTPDSEVSFPNYPSHLLQKIGKEMNLSETAFVVPKRIKGSDGDVSLSRSHYDLRWFTPTVEVNLCGHATLATAHTIFKELAKDGGSLPQTLYFNTLSGELTVKLVSNSDSLEEPRLQMNFPQGFPKKITLEESVVGELMEALFIEKRESILEVHHCEKTRKLVVEVTNSHVVKKLKPNFTKLMQVGFPDSTVVKGVIVTTRASIAEPGEEAFDFVSRYFAPWVGIDEDPVTGSAHCVLTPYWSVKLGKKHHRAFQASERGGILGLELVEEESRVLLEGTAVTVLEGKINLSL